MEHGSVRSPRHGSYKYVDDTGRRQRINPPPPINPVLVKYTQ